MQGKGDKTVEHFAPSRRRTEPTANRFLKFSCQIPTVPAQKISAKSGRRRLGSVRNAPLSRHPKEEPSETSTESQIEPVEKTSEKYITNINNNIYLCTFGVDSYISFSFV